MIVLRIGLSLLLVVAVSVVDDSDTDEDVGDEDTREATDLIDEVLVAVDGDRTPCFIGRGHSDEAEDAESDNDKTADGGEDSTGNRLTATRTRVHITGDELVVVVVAHCL